MYFNDFLEYGDFMSDCLEEIENMKKFNKPAAKHEVPAKKIR